VGHILQVAVVMPEFAAAEALIVVDNELLAGVGGTTGVDIADGMAERHMIDRNRAAVVRIAAVVGQLEVEAAEELERDAAVLVRIVALATEQQLPVRPDFGRTMSVAGWPVEERELIAGHSAAEQPAVAPAQSKQLRQIWTALP